MRRNTTDSFIKVKDRPSQREAGILEVPELEAKTEMKIILRGMLSLST